MLPLFSDICRARKPPVLSHNYKDVLHLLQELLPVLPVEQLPHSITTETNLQYELYLTGLESRILARTARTGKRVPWEVAVDAD